MRQDFRVASVIAENGRSSRAGKSAQFPEAKSLRGRIRSDGSSQKNTWTKPTRALTFSPFSAGQTVFHYTHDSPGFCPLRSSRSFVWPFGWHEHPDLRRLLPHDLLHDDHPAAAKAAK